MNNLIGQTAVIMGASISGIMAANAICDRFKRVVIIDKDDISSQTASSHRRYVPQSRQTHILLAGGLNAIESLIPGYMNAARAKGAVHADATAGFESLFPQGYLPEFNSGIDVLCMSRPLIEGTMRELTYERCSNLEWRFSTNIEHVSLSANAQHVVRIRSSDNAEEEIVADFLIDARGRASDSASLLEAFGIQTTSKRMKPYVGYTTVWLGADVKMPEGKVGLIELAKEPDHPIGGVVFRIEGGGHVFTLFGYNKHYPPSNWEEIVEATKNFRGQHIYSAIRDSKPGAIETFRKHENYFNAYADKGRWLENFLVVGDAVSSFNPIYGQGITTSAKSIVRMKHVMAAGGSALKMQNAITREYSAAWVVAGNEDLRWPDTEVLKRPLGIRMIHSLSDKIGRASSNNNEVALEYVKVLHMLSPPEAMMSPKVLWKVFRNQ